MKIGEICFPVLYFRATFKKISIAKLVLGLKPHHEVMGTLENVTHRTDVEGRLMGKIVIGVLSMLIEQ